MTTCMALQAHQATFAEEGVSERFDFIITYTFFGGGGVLSLHGI